MVKSTKWKLSSLSLRTRLSGAFVILIITSASATIGIGNAVFGQKVVELAASKMEVGLKAAEVTLSSHVHALDLATTLNARTLRDNIDPESVCSVIQSDPSHIEFALIVEKSKLTGFAGDTSSKSGCAPLSDTQDIQAWQPLVEFARESSRGDNTAGLIILNRERLLALGYRAPPSRGLLMAAAASISESRLLLLGSLINGRREFVAEPVGLIWPEQKDTYDASIFLEDTRIATTISKKALGTTVDHKVVVQVLHDQQPFVGTAQVVGSDYHTAYAPLRDFRGDAIGMIGIGSREEAYTDLRRQTTGLFSSLIAAGMVFGFIMTYMFSALLIRPIAELARGMNRVAKGDLNFKVRVSSSDELGRLAQAFNLMVKNTKERDIRLREMTEEQLSHVEKQVSVGRLAAGVAHEINNPLTSVLSLSMLMQKGASEEDPRKEDLDIIVTETTRCREIVRHLLDFARETPIEKRYCDINDIIRETLVLASRYDAMDQVQTLVELSGDPLVVDGDPGQLQQVITNLVTNAAEAMDSKGRIVISTEEDSSGGFVVVVVKDTGKGITQSAIDRVFEPFFTTKGPGKGTGLGLSVSLGIVRHHNGSIEIESDEGQGTAVTIMLPRVVDQNNEETP